MQRLHATCRVLILAFASVVVGCDSTEKASDASPANGSVSSPVHEGSSSESTSAEEASSDSGFFGWIDAINPFKDDTRASVESYRVSESTRGDGLRQASVDVDLSRGDGPRSLLAAFTRAWRLDEVANGTVERLDLISLIVRDDPDRMMLFDESPALLIVGRERIELTPLPPASDSVKRAGDELQTRRSFRVPDGVLDRLVEGAPVQLVVVIGGQEVKRTIPGAACAAIESAAPRDRAHRDDRAAAATLTSAAAR